MEAILLHWLVTSTLQDFKRLWKSGEVVHCSVWNSAVSVKSVVIAIFTQFWTSTQPLVSNLILLPYRVCSLVKEARWLIQFSSGVQSSTLCYYDLTILMDFDHCLGINYQSSDCSFLYRKLICSCPPLFRHIFCRSLLHFCLYSPMAMLLLLSFHKFGQINKMWCRAIHICDLNTINFLQ